MHDHGHDLSFSWDNQASSAEESILFEHRVKTLPTQEPCCGFRQETSAMKYAEQVTSSVRASGNLFLSTLLLLLLAMARQTCLVNQSQREHTPSPSSSSSALASKSAARSFSRRSESTQFKPTTVLPVILLTLLSLCSPTSSQDLNPTCNHNTCTMHPSQCVWTCPVNMRGQYFTFGSRSQNRCVSVPRSVRELAEAHENQTVPPQIESDEAVKRMGSESKGLALMERQDLFPEYGPPRCSNAGCRFVGPPCILFCTETSVYYGSNEFCVDNMGPRGGAEVAVGRPGGWAVLVVWVVVLLGAAGFARGMV